MGNRQLGASLVASQRPARHALSTLTPTSYCDHHACMARTVTTHITDDIDGTKDAEEVRFGYLGAEYTIDLSKKNRTALEKALQPYLDAGTKVQPSGRQRRTSSRSTTRRDLQAVREWAKVQGIDISDRGRVSGAVLEQYDAAVGK